MSDEPQTPSRDHTDNEDFGPSESMGQGYPEESPDETQPEGEPRNPREGQEQPHEG